MGLSLEQGKYLANGGAFSEAKLLVEYPRAEYNIIKSEQKERKYEFKSEPGEDL